MALDNQPGRRINNARIAALTGLTRSEVSQLALSPAVGVSSPAAPVNRAQQVSLGWISDSEFCDKAGKPSCLPFSGNRRSFKALVKRYSGDIPARAMLSEMKRLGLAREEKGSYVRLVRVDPPISRRASTALSALSPWINFLSEVDRDEDRKLDADSVRLTLTFSSLPQLFAAVRELQDRAEAFVKSVNELGNNKGSTSGHKLHVSIALATRVPESE